MIVFAPMTLCLTAGVFDLREISENWGSNSIPMPVVLVSVGFLVLVLGIFGSIRLYRTRRQRSRPGVIFHHLARGCGLSVADELLLWRVARQQALPTPTTLLLSARTLRHHARRYAAGLRRSRQRRIMARVWDIRAALRRRHRMG